MYTCTHIICLVYIWWCTCVRYKSLYPIMCIRNKSGWYICPQIIRTSKQFKCTNRLPIHIWSFLSFDLPPKTYISFFSLTMPQCIQWHWTQQISNVSLSFKQNVHMYTDHMYTYQTKHTLVNKTNNSITYTLVCGHCFIMYTYHMYTNMYMMYTNHIHINLYKPSAL